MDKLLLILLFGLSLQGCTAENWFAGFVEGQKYQCNKLAGMEREHCLDAIISDYDQYQRERDESRQCSK